MDYETIIDVNATFGRNASLQCPYEKNIEKGGKTNSLSVSPNFNIKKFPWKIKANNLIL